MAERQENRIEEVMFSFSYTQAQQASRCNDRLSQLVMPILVPEMESAFDQVSYPLFQLELEKLEIDLGRITEDEISEGLGMRIRHLLVRALSDELKLRVNNSTLSTQSNSLQQEDYALAALRSFFLKGYFPAWLEKDKDLYSLLEVLLSTTPKAVGMLAREVSLKSEAARIRIAVLNTPFFDRIIGVMVPEEVDWLIGYRNSYIQVHESESLLPGSSKSLEQALNLFILNFIVNESGTKFNRFSFSERALKAIAAHYNIDFQTFLKEIKKIVANRSPKNQLDQDFKEAIIWVGEKNRVNEESFHFTEIPGISQFAHWLNHTPQHPDLLHWIEDREGTGGLFQQLAVQYPRFWRLLNERGFENLVKVLGRADGGKWNSLLQDYLDWGDKQKDVTGSMDRLGHTRQLFDIVWAESSFRRTVLYDLEGWFSILVIHASGHQKQNHSWKESLVQLGLAQGISNAPILLLRNDKHGGTAPVDLLTLPAEGRKTSREVVPGKQVDGQLSMAQEYKIQELALREYLRSGSLGKSFQELNRNDLVDVISAMMKLNNPLLINWIKEVEESAEIPAKRRLWALFKRSERKVLLGFMENHGGEQTQGLLRFQKILEQTIAGNSQVKSRLDQLIWISFVKETSESGKSTPSVSLTETLVKMGAMVSILSQIPDLSVTDRRRITVSGKSLHILKSFLLLSPKDPMTESSVMDLFGYLVSSAHRLPAWSYTSLAKKDYKKLDFGKLTAIDPSQKRVLQYFVEFYLSVSVRKLLLVHQLDAVKTRQEAILFIKKDLKSLVRSSLLSSAVTFNPRDKQEAIRRVFAFTVSNKEQALPLFKQYRSQLVLMLFHFKETLKVNEWKRFESYISVHFYQELSHFKKLHFSIGQMEWPSFLQLTDKSVVKGITSRLGVDDMLRLMSSSNLSSGIIERLGRESNWTPGFLKKLTFLRSLPDAVFYHSPLIYRWKRLVSLSVLKIRTETNREIETKFWSAFLGNLKQGFSTYDLRMLDWNYLLYSDELQKADRSRLIRFLKQHSSAGLSRTTNSAIQVHAASALIFLKEEGFLPWWAPVKTKMGLLSTFICQSEFSDQKDASPIVWMFFGENTDQLIAGLKQDELIKLYKLLTKSSHSNYFDSFLRLLDQRIQDYKEVPQNVKKKELLSVAQNGIVDLKNKSITEISLLIRKHIGLCNEEKLVQEWFYYDPRLQKQLIELMKWSSWMYFGSLNPGRWKLLLISFGVDFYIKKGNGFSRMFLNQFLSFLNKTQSTVNWKRVFHLLLKNKGFTKDLGEANQQVISNIYPVAQQVLSDEPNPGDHVRLTNAGLVLCWPFLSVLFSRLEISENNKIPEISQSRAVYLLQYLVYGHYDFPEYELVLNKILVGMKISQHLEKVKLSPEEKEMADSLLVGMKSNWDKMKNASIEAIRETFLQREGNLEIESERYVLRVPKTGVDVLLESIPWSIAVVRLAWMEKSLDVKWR
ncbi:contractile injection system tape measure protein [Algoriphagus sp. NG3]|uniref:contractile injection system tape measure protein n=1 Tax=Algoriphagus sp. NG3 TaxID=3097546 RepID=UPI002A8402A9|nr:contractile injection system tape measure protein [Algoriphagus sp. NG3]WPR77334.1 contractile injection system tape measure protein [Algoriphagus sp. NG3]